jgi:hypothetical protein
MAWDSPGPQSSHVIGSPCDGPNNAAAVQRRPWSAQQHVTFWSSTVQQAFARVTVAEHTLVIEVINRDLILSLA